MVRSTLGGKGLLCLLLLSLLTLPAHAAPPVTPKTLVIIAPPGLSYDDLRPISHLHELRDRFAAWGSVGLLNPAVGGEQTDAAAFLTLGAGDRMAVPDHTSPLVAEAGVPRTVADFATEAYTVKSFEGPATRKVYARRFGVPLPAGATVAHVGVPSIRAAQASARLTGLVGALGEALKNAGKRVSVYGDWPAALAGMDAGGVVPGGSIYRPIGPKQIPATILNADVAFVYAPDKEKLRFYARAALPLGRRGIANVLIIEPSPLRGSKGDKWTRLGWILAVGPRFPRGDVLTSPTTRTPGLVANIDIAPTILALQNAESLGNSGSGRAIYPTKARSAWGVISRLDAQATATAKVWPPLMIAWTILAIGSGLAAALSLHRENAILRLAARSGLLIASAVYISLIPVGWLAPHSISGYMAAVFGLAIAIAASAFYAGRALRQPPLTLIFAALILIVMGDSLFGAPLLQRAINNFLPGIRFYGVGNEYLGMAVGAALIGGAQLRSLPRWIMPAVWIALTLLISLPWFGAKAGGALTATFAFALAYFGRKGIRIQGRQCAAAFAAGLVMLAVVTGLDVLRPDASRTHIGEAAASGAAQGMAPLAEIAIRKLGMNLAIATSPWTLVALALLVPLWWLLTNGATGVRARAALVARPRLAAVLPAAIGGAVVALLFNDSGIIAALLILACPTVAVLLSMLEDADRAASAPTR